MKYLTIVLLCFSLFQAVACSNTPKEQPFSEEVPKETNTESDAPNSTIIPPVAEMEPESATIAAEDAAPAIGSTATPQAVKTADKVAIEKTATPSEPVPTKTFPQTERTNSDPAPEEFMKQETAHERNTSTTTTAPSPVSTVEAVSTATEVEDRVEKKPDHAAWDALLQQYVTSSGKVNYAGFKSNKAKLQAYLDDLAANPVEAGWSRAEKMAYWINVYNAFTIKLIVDHFPVQSITKLHGGKPWDVKWIKLGDKTYSLNQVENDILRPQYKDARIHFAVNCAAKSCPPLLNRAWTGGNLENYLEKQTRSFINSAKYNSINSGKAQVSKIFEWYATDFGNLIDFLNQYSETSIKANAAVSYQEYDWALNN